MCIGPAFRVRCKVFGSDLLISRIECLDIQGRRNYRRFAQSSPTLEVSSSNLPAGAILNPGHGWTLSQHSFGSFPEPNQ